MNSQRTARERLHPVLHSFKTQIPMFRLEQAASVEWLAQLHCASEQARNKAQVPDLQTRRRVIRFANLNDRIKTRHSVNKDVLQEDPQDTLIFDVHQDLAGAGSYARSMLYSEIVNDVFENFYSDGKKAPASIVHVTCTGYVSPSGGQRLVARKGWSETEVLHAYHMGCYGSLPAIRIATGSLGLRPEGICDIVHTELCSLHLDPSDHSLEQLTIQTLFADGLIRYSVSLDEDCAAAERGPSLKVLALLEEIIPGTEELMSWVVGDHGMKMSLSREVPQKIAGRLKPFLNRLIDSGDPKGNLGLSLAIAKRKAIFAVHPGGPQIIDRVRDILELSQDQVLHSNQILEAHGNMSSATLPHIWKLILEDPSIDRDQWVISLAFGPGLTISGAIFQKVLP